MQAYNLALTFMHLASLQVTVLTEILYLCYNLLSGITEKEKRPQRGRFSIINILFI
jgi:hypothetical protein